MDRLDRLEARLEAQPDTGDRDGDRGRASRFCSLPDVPPRPLPSDLSPGRAALIRSVEKKWVNGTRLRYYFFPSGQYAAGEDQKDLVREGFEIWKEVGIGVHFEEVTDISEAEVRIGFLRGDGAWSYVGRDVIDVPGQGDRTMNFGWDLTTDPRRAFVAVHEIGHTLGFPHEHQNPFSGIVWDEEAVYQYFGGDPNRWDRQTTFFNILRKLPNGEVEGTKWDPDSIMHYAFPAGLIVRPDQYRQGLEPAGGLSAHDIEQVRKFYPTLDEAKSPELVPFQSQALKLKPAEQANFVIRPTATRNYTMQTFGQSDTLMVLFEDRNGHLRYVDGDDDSGTESNARIATRLVQGRCYLLRIRLYYASTPGETAVMLW